MGLFSASSPPAKSPSLENPTPSPDGAFEAPNRQSRAHCWEARDTFFACLERNGIVDSIKEKERAGEVCGAENKGLERECAASWVSEVFGVRVQSVCTGGGLGEREGLGEIPSEGEIRIE